MTEPQDPPVNHLRDARLQQALAHAPDAQATPSTASRVAIKKLASYAISSRLDGDFSLNNSTKPWWRRLWQNAGRPSASWNAAFATILLGSIITLVWYEKDVPDAALAEKTETMANAARPATPPVATLPSPGVAPSPEPAQGGIKPPEAATKATAPRDLAKSKRSGGTAPPVPPAESVASAAPEAPTESRLVLPTPAMAEKSVQSSPALADAGRASQELAGVERKERAISTPAATGEAGLAQSSRPATTRPQPAAPAPAPAPAIAAAAPAPLSRAAPGRARSQGEVMASPWTRIGNWTSAELSYQGRVVRLSRPQAQALADQLLAQVAANAGTGSGEAQGAPALRLQLLDTSGNLAEFELWRGTFKWRRRGEAELIGTLSVDQAAALLQEGARLIPP